MDCVFVYMEGKVGTAHCLSYGREFGSVEKGGYHSPTLAGSAVYALMGGPALPSTLHASVLVLGGQ